MNEITAAVNIHEKRQRGTGVDRILLVFNCHEPWIHQLGVLGYSLDIIVGLKGKYNEGWDYRMRPLPAHARLVTLPEALQSPKEYYCIITHNTTDLLDARFRPEPRLLVLHHTLEGRLREEHSTIDPQKMKDMLHHYIELVGGHVVATSMFKGESWGFTDDIVPFGIDVNDYLPYSGHVAAGLRVCNFISSRRQILLCDSTAYRKISSSSASMPKLVTLDSHRSAGPPEC